jgi:vancomycin resistance protein YoaR
METMAPNVQWQTRRHALDLRMLALAALLLVLLVPLVYLGAYRGRIYPGVYAAGIHLGGATPGQAIDRLTDGGFAPDAPVVLRATGREWRVHPADVGIVLDAQATVQSAFGVGRGGTRASAALAALRARARGTHVAPALTFDAGPAQDTLGDLADTYDEPAANAGFTVVGLDVQPLPARPGRALGIDTGVEAIRSAVEAGHWPVEVELPSVELRATVENVDAALEAARHLLRGPIALRAGPDRNWSLPPEALAPMLAVDPDAPGGALAVDLVQLESWFAPIQAEIGTPAENPRFTFDAETRRLRAKRPGSPGVAIDAAATAERLLQLPSGSERTVELALKQATPLLADELDAAELGITGLIHSETSRYSGSPAERVHNIALAAERYDGVLVPPGATFSFNQQLGDVTAEAGYKETLIIMDGTTADGVGGGVCQVSTTLFRAAFWSGLPIVERHAHGYRVAYYEQGNVPPGLDATIYSPVVDLKFQNDTAGWLLIEAFANRAAATLTFEIYGPSLNREVRIEGPSVSRQVPPPAPRVEIDPALPDGATRRVEHPRAGADVSVVRVVKTGDEEKRETFHSRYRPTGSIVAVSASSAEAAAAATPEGAPAPTTEASSP